MMRVVIGAELHDPSTGISHTGTSFNERRGTRGPFKKAGTFIKDCGGPQHKVVPCTCDHGELSECPDCKGKEDE